MTPKTKVSSAANGRQRAARVSSCFLRIRPSRSAPRPRVMKTTASALPALPGRWCGGPPGPSASPTPHPLHTPASRAVGTSTGGNHRALGTEPGRAPRTCTPASSPCLAWHPHPCPTAGHPKSMLRAPGREEKERQGPAVRTWAAGDPSGPWVPSMLARWLSAHGHKRQKSSGGRSRWNSGSKYQGGQDGEAALEGKLGRGRHLLAVRGQVSLSLKDSDRGLVLWATSEQEACRPGSPARCFPLGAHRGN